MSGAPAPTAQGGAAEPPRGSARLTEPVGATAARIRSHAPALQPSERQVAAILLERADEIAVLSSGDIAALAGSSRTTVVRTAQHLGFSGYQQLRALLARDALVGHTAHGGQPGPADREAIPGTDTRAGAGAASRVVVEHFDRLAATAETMTALLDPVVLDEAVEQIACARRLLIVGNGLSISLAIDAVARLARLGIDANRHEDVIQQQIAARLLGPDDVVLVISGSGANRASVQVALAAREAGACVIAVTAFAASALARAADLVLVACVAGSRWEDELADATRIPEATLIEGLALALRQRLGKRAAVATGVAVEVVSAHVDH